MRDGRKREKKDDIVKGQTIIYFLNIRKNKMNKELKNFREVYERYITLGIKSFSEVRKVITAFTLASITNDSEDIMKIVREVNK
jgi:hypothetical protein